MPSVNRRTRMASAALVLLAAGVVPVMRQAPVAAGATTPATVGSVQVNQALAHDISPPLSAIPPLTPTSLPGSGPATATSPVQVWLGHPGGGGPNIPSTSSNFDGIPQGTCGAWIPPDSSAAAGTSQVVEVTNMSIAVYSKSGGVELGPECTATLWSNFPYTGCQRTDNGDATVVWDSLASRFVVSVPSSYSTPPLQCVAVSVDSNALDGWYRYAFPYSSPADYPKLGVWSDGYYETGNTPAGPVVCAYDRSSMLSGFAASEQCFYNPIFGSWSSLPASVDGPVPPPPGEPEWVMNIASNSALRYWKFLVNWTDPALSQMIDTNLIGVNTFTEACGGGSGSCIPQPGTTQVLHSLSDRLMYRLAYRNFGAYESLVVNHSVNSGSSVGVRWYEMREVAGQGITVFQQGTYQPDSNYRFMGSIAQDKVGDIAVGYTLSSSSTYPSVAYTGRLAIDLPGTMSQGEGLIQWGSGSSVGSGEYWGDYSEMTVDPTDDCTFWYVNEYLPTTGGSAWHTRIGSFSFPTCTIVPAG